MKIGDIKKIAIVGAGVMGAQIAQLCAQYGYQVKLMDISDAILKNALERIRSGPFGLERGVERGRLTEAQVHEAFSKIKTITNMGDAVKDVDIVIESVPEREDLKRNVFRKLDELSPERTILATDTSSILITSIASATDRPDRVIGMHFSQPVVVSKFMEIIPGLRTSQETIKLIEGLSVKLGKTPVVLKKDSPGFVSNRLYPLILCEAMRCYEEGLATPEQIDTLVETGFNWPMGPFEMADFVGLDVLLDLLNYLYRHFGDMRYKAPFILVKMVQTGYLGRKSGRGFYEYEK